MKKILKMIFDILVSFSDCYTNIDLRINDNENQRFLTKQ